MPEWGWYAIAAIGAAAAAGGAFVLARVLWRVQVRRYVVRLVGRLEAVRAGWRTLKDVVERLAQADDEEMTAFATDPGHLDRKALAEVSSQQSIAHEELATMALPKQLWPVAEALAEAASALADESGRVGETAGAQEVLSGLERIDLARAQRFVAAGEERVGGVCDEYGIEEAAVYGGGLYI